jgi:hypothetical protein
MGQKNSRTQEEEERRRQSTGTLTANDINVMVFLGHGRTVDVAFQEAKKRHPKIRRDRTTFTTTYVRERDTGVVKPMYEAYFEGNEAQFRMYLDGK